MIRQVSREWNYVTFTRDHYISKLKWVSIPVSAKMLIKSIRVKQYYTSPE